MPACARGTGQGHRRRRLAVIRYLPYPRIFRGPQKFGLLADRASGRTHDRRFSPQNGGLERLPAALSEEGPQGHRRRRLAEMRYLLRASHFLALSRNSACSPICRLTLGAGGDDATAAKYRATLAANMTPTQVAQALSLAAAWRPKHDWGALLK